MKKYLIRTYFREDLETMLKSTYSPFTKQEIEAELKRRDEFVRAAQDTNRYPELQPAFH